MKKIIKNKNKLILREKFLRLYLNKKIKPGWLEKDYVEIIIPSVYENKTIGTNLVYSKDGNKVIPLIVEGKSSIVFNFDIDEIRDYITSEKFCKRKRPIQTYLPFHYHKVPFRMFLGKILTNVSKSHIKNINFPKWPIDDSLETLNYIENKIKNKKIKKEFIVALSHDVDTGTGFNNIPKFLNLENKYGVVSTWFIVGNYYPLSKKIFSELSSKGHEIGLHGYNHDGKLPYLSNEIINRRLKIAVNRLRSYGADLYGFRATSLSISDKLDKNLKKYFLYSSSVVDTELVLPDAIKCGSCSLKPFYKNGLLQIPITVPMDSSLILLGYKPNEILNLWIEKIKWIKQVGGVATIVTHTENHFSANEEMLMVYDKLLNWLKKDKNTKFVTYMEIAKQYKNSVS